MTVKAYAPMRIDRLARDGHHVSTRGAPGELAEKGGQSGKSLALPDMQRIRARTLMRNQSKDWRQKNE